MTQVTDTLIDRMVRAIVDEVDPEQVILFGSRGRGDERQDSDVDLVVVEAEPFGPERSRHKEMVRLYHVLAGFPVATDILVYSHEDVDYWRDSLNHVLARVLREGRALYEQQPVPMAECCAKARCSFRDVKCARMLVEATERHVLTLRNLTAAAPEESFGFHVQQAAEKAFKAWLALLGEMYPLTHNLEALLGLLADRGVATKPFRKLINYTPYAVKFRYEGVNSSTEPIDREDALTLVETLLKQVRRQLAEQEGA